MGAAYLAFVVPELRERRFEYDPESKRGRTLARLLGWLDWCARFEIVPRAPSDTTAGAYRVIGRDGVAKRGLRGAAVLAEATPVLFPLWLPLALLAKLEKM